jgi:hypothetical protein
MSGEIPREVLLQLLTLDAEVAPGEWAATDSAGEVWRLSRDGSPTGEPVVGLDCPRHNCAGVVWWEGLENGCDGRLLAVIARNWAPRMARRLLELEAAQ